MLIAPILDKTAVYDGFVENVRKEVVQETLVLLDFFTLHALSYRVDLFGTLTHSTGREIVAR